MADPALLRSALLRCKSASEWANKAGLINVGQELNVAAKEIAEYLNKMPIEREKP